MVPFDCFSISAAHSLVAGISGCAGGSQIEIFRSTVLSWARTGAASNPRASARTSFFILRRSSVIRLYCQHTGFIARHEMEDSLAARRTALELLVACLDKGQPLD